MGVKVILSCGLVPGRVLCCPSNVRVVFGTLFSVWFGVVSVCLHRLPVVTFGSICH
ncbi:hypothetical protein GQ607_007256 [Colletotrichum asianum]|uniref:Uncharacterized protein n=1 Tax=Colletotrichum asianum TaxID=702518 RepID=A0A8H3WFS7_9PEZI|nr:hypothetical protein GQ607_007256 [Colletotrichum asianum]